MLKPLWMLVVVVSMLSVAGCERKEKVLDVEVGGDDGVKIEGFKSDKGDVEVKIDERN
jgi:hypothetical protein